MALRSHFRIPIVALGSARNATQLFIPTLGELWLHPVDSYERFCRAAGGRAGAGWGDLDFVPRLRKKHKDVSTRQTAQFAEEIASGFPRIGAAPFPDVHSQTTPPPTHHHHTHPTHTPINPFSLDPKQIPEFRRGAFRFRPKRRGFPGRLPLSFPHIPPSNI